VLAEVDADRLALGRPPSRVRPFAETDPYHHGPSQAEAVMVPKEKVTVPPAVLA
jgi:hypothetical protein